MENIIVKGIVSATTNKESDKFKKDEPAKTAYFIINDNAEKEKLKKFGLMEYTPKDTKEGSSPFFMCPCAKSIKVYDSTDVDAEPTEINCLISEKTPNFKTGEVKLNFIKGENMGKMFIRLQAILGEVELVKAQNPFA